MVQAQRISTICCCFFFPFLSYAIENNCKPAEIFFSNRAPNRSGTQQTPTSVAIKLMQLFYGYGVCVCVIINQSIKKNNVEYLSTQSTTASNSLVHFEHWQIGPRWVKNETKNCNAFLRNQNLFNAYFVTSIQFSWIVFHFFFFFFLSNSLLIFFPGNLSVSLLFALRDKWKRNKWKRKKNTKSKVE